MEILGIFAAKYLIFIILILAVGYFLTQSRSAQKNIFYYALLVLPIAYIVAKVSSHFYFDPRPFVVGHFVPVIPHDPDNGFPSDHTLLAAAMALIVFRSNKKLGLALIFLTLVVGLARVYLGLHHVIDIIGSLIITIVVGVVIDWYVAPRFIKSNVK